GYKYASVFNAIEIVKRVYGNLIWYAGEIRRTMASNFLLLFFFIGLVLSLIFSREKRSFLILLSWLIGAFFLLSFMRWKDARYAVAALPPLAIITIGGIDSLPKKNIKTILPLIIACVGFAQFFMLSFNIPSVLIKKNDYFYNWQPRRQDWKIKEIVEYISEKFGNKKIMIGMLPNCDFFNHDELILYITLGKLPYTVTGLFNPRAIEEQLKNCDVAVTKKPFSSIYYNNEGSGIYERLTGAALDSGGFRAARSFDLPDKSKAIIYEK
ncbi:MAG: hypothetical protein WC312_06640, partial [Candidatus Omnitrophota bacterium]